MTEVRYYRVEVHSYTWNPTVQKASGILRDKRTDEKNSWEAVFDRDRGRWDVTTERAMYTIAQQRQVNEGIANVLGNVNIPYSRDVNVKMD